MSCWAGAANALKPPTIVKGGINGKIWSPGIKAAVKAEKKAFHDWKSSGKNNEVLKNEVN